MIQEEGLYVYGMYNILEKHFSISIAPVQSRGGSLVFNITKTCDSTELSMYLSSREPFKFLTDAFLLALYPLN
jgi:hypothetical protein